MIIQMKMRILRILYYIENIENIANDDPVEWNSSGGTVLYPSIVYIVADAAQATDPASFASTASETA